VVIIVFNRVILFLEFIHKQIPSGIDPKYSRFLYGIFIPISFPPMFEMGEGLKDHKFGLLSIKIFVEREITF
jgi:hypothetical protein